MLLLAAPQAAQEETALLREDLQAPQLRQIFIALVPWERHYLSGWVAISFDISEAYPGVKVRSQDLFYSV